MGKAESSRSRQRAAQSRGWAGAPNSGVAAHLLDAHGPAGADNPLIKSARGDAAAIDAQNLIEAINQIIDDSPELNGEERAIVRDHVEMAVYEAHARIASESKGDCDLKPPLRELSPQEVAAIKRRGQSRPWSHRGDDHRGPVEWVREVYSDWIPGMLRGHILKADRTLYFAFMQEVRRSGLPSDLDIPTAAENRMRAISCPKKRRALAIARTMHAARVRYLNSEDA